MSDTSSVAAKQIETAKAFIEGYNKWNADDLLAPRTDDCIHAMLPVSLGRPPRTNADYKLFFGNLEPHINHFKITIQKIVNDSEQHMAVVHATGSGETKFMDYRNEYAFFLKFTEDGSKVERVEEFVDSKFSEAFFESLQAYLQGKEPGFEWKSFVKGLAS